MSHGLAPVAVRIAETQSLSVGSRLTLMLPVLCLVVLASGCSALAGAPGATSCPDSVRATVGPAKPTVKVSYTEPTVSVGGDPLKDLAKTTIYYDLGKGRTVAKEIPATKPGGGGQISETITIPVHTKGDQSVRICVTATDRQGNESAMTP